MKKMEKVWGHEEWIVNTEKYCGKKLILKEGYQSSLHYHKQKDETFYIFEGEVYLEVNGTATIMKPGDTIRILPGQRHRFSGLENSVIFEFSTHHDEEDSYREEGQLSREIPDFENWRKEILNSKQR